MLKQPIFKIFMIALAASSLFAFPKTVKKKYYLPSSNFSVGIAMGNETGIVFKYFANKTTAYSGMFSKTMDYEYFNVNYLLHDHTYFSNPSISIYYGLGMRNKNSSNEDESKYGLRIPFGATYLFKTTPFDLFFEIAPELTVSPESKFEFSSFIGGRFWF